MDGLGVDLNSIGSVAYFTGNNFNFFNMVNRALEQVGTNRVIFAADSYGEYWRHTLYPDYKGKRDDDPGRNVMLKILIESLEEGGYKVYQEYQLEADDILASLPRPNCIFTKDRDLWQCWPKSKILLPDYTFLTEQVILDTYGVNVAKLSEFKALAGDSGDNIPGVVGIGPKWASKLLNEYDNIDGIYSNLKNLPSGIARKLDKGRDTINFWHELVRLKEIELQDLEWLKVTDRFQKAVRIMAKRMRDEG